MTRTDRGGPHRVLAEAIGNLPGGLVAVPTTPDHLDALTSLQRTCDLAGCGHTSTNVQEVRDELSDPECGWARGSATVWRGAELVGALTIVDGLATGHGWMLDVYARPGDPDTLAIQDLLIAAAIEEGRARWTVLDPRSELPAPTAKSGCFVGDTALRADLERWGFAEVRRFWRMRIDHASPRHAGTGTSGADRYLLRRFRDVDSEFRALHAAHMDAFSGHFDFTPADYPTWRAHVGGDTMDPSQWIVCEHEGSIVGFAVGSNRYASEGCGYVRAIGVLAEHRGRGLARRMLMARFADDAARGLRSTLLHVDAANTTGATRLYESVGMATDSATVWSHRPLLDP
ncbi:MAG: GNAT family N-acetyltransferase [Candidatus Nanopelagicales bacterium]